MKYINLFFCLIVGLSFTAEAQNNRYLDEVFDNVTVTKDITYATNISILTGAPAPIDLKMDIYEPVGDDTDKRPMIIMFHSGNFLPFPVNQSTSGTKEDSTVVGLARRLAKMGYVVASATNRMGWLPTAPEQPRRVNTLINAAYRGVQDARSAIRFTRKTIEADGNPYKIDTERIILWGVGTGGYITLNTTVLDSYQKTLIPKFIETDEEGNPVPMVLEALSGDPFALVATPLNLPNHTEYSSDFNLCVNVGGAMGDVAWMDQGHVPMISYHVPSDPFAPYTEGLVIVPGLNLPVVNVNGSYAIQETANQLGNNNVFVNANFNDPYTQRANANNDGLEGLFPFVREDNPLDSAPWDWWSPNNVNNNNGLATNPDMSFEKAMIYADSILGYFAPRAFVALDLQDLVSSRESVLDNSNIKIMPNPASTNVLISATTREPIREMMVIDMNGKVVRAYKNINNHYFNIDRNGLSTGMYIIQTRFDSGVTTNKLMFD